MKKVFVFVFCFVLGAASGAMAQTASLNKAKYVTVLKVIAEHKMDDQELVADIDKLRQYDKFKKELVKMMNKLDNSKPNEIKNRKIIKILERAGKEIYDELK